MAVIESIRLQRVQFETLAGHPDEARQAPCEVRTHARPAGEGRASVLLVARLFEGHPAPPFRLEVAVEGVFRLDPGDSLPALARGAGPATLYHHLRDEVAHVTLRAGFAPVLLPPRQSEAPVPPREGVN